MVFRDREIPHSGMNAGPDLGHAGRGGSFLCARFCPQGGEGQMLSLQHVSGESDLGLFCVMSTFGCMVENVPPLQGT